MNLRTIAETVVPQLLGALSKILYFLFAHPLLSILLAMSVFALMVICAKAFGGKHGVLKAKNMCFVACRVCFVLLIINLCLYPFYKSLNADSYGLFIGVWAAMILFPLMMIFLLFAVVFKLMSSKEK